MYKISKKGSTVSLSNANCALKYFKFDFNVCNEL